MDVFDLYSPVIDVDPFPYYAILREQYPCYWSERGKLWILSRYDDVFRAAQDWETFSSSQGNMIDELPGRAGATLGTTDPPRHDRLRGLSQAAFARKNLQHLIEPTNEIADAALERICARGRFDFIADFSSRITVGVLFKLMGLPARDDADIRRKVILAVSTDKAARGRTAEHVAAFKELSDFLAAEVAERRAHPTDDLITLSRGAPSRRRRPEPDRAGDRGIAAVQHLGPAVQTCCDARGAVARPDPAGRRQGRARLRFRQPRWPQIPQP
jgi:cytochrome P450